MKRSSNGRKRNFPAWQQDAVRRILSQDSISDNDIDELYGMLRKDVGLSDEGEQTASPVPVRADGKVTRSNDAFYGASRWIFRMLFRLRSPLSGLSWASVAKWFASVGSYTCWAGLSCNRPLCPPAFRYLDSGLCVRGLQCCEQLLALINGYGK